MSAKAEIAALGLRGATRDELKKEGLWEHLLTYVNIVMDCFEHVVYCEIEYKEDPDMPIKTMYLISRVHVKGDLDSIMEQQDEFYERIYEEIPDELHSKYRMVLTCED